MSLRSFLLAGIGMVALGGAASAQPKSPPSPADATLPRTLMNALALSYATNPTLLTERAKLRATDEAVPTALAGWRPTIVVSGSGGYTNENSYSYGAGGRTR